MSDELFDLMMNRVSFPRLESPAPSKDLMEKLFQSALRTPDHMKLKPWRFLVIEGDGRKSLGDVFRRSAELDDSDLSQAKKDKFTNMPMRAPVIVVGISKNLSHAKVPKTEQVISCGVAMGYMLLGLQSKGFGGVWRTGPLAENSYVMSALGLDSSETIVGFLYMGTPTGEPKKIQLSNSADHFCTWPKA